eukprot:COSAG04_NODE_6354_length_1349_cov_1.465600_1_plen_127_part_10
MGAAEVSRAVSRAAATVERGEEEHLHIYLPDAASMSVAELRELPKLAVEAQARLERTVARAAVHRRQQLAPGKRLTARKGLAPRKQIPTGTTSSDEEEGEDDDEDDEEDEDDSSESDDEASHEEEEE